MELKVTVEPLFTVVDVLLTVTDGAAMVISLYPVVVPSAAVAVILNVPPAIPSVAVSNPEVLNTPDTLAPVLVPCSAIDHVTAVELWLVTDDDICMVYALLDRVILAAVELTVTVGVFTVTVLVCDRAVSTVEVAVTVRTLPLVSAAATVKAPDDALMVVPALCPVLVIAHVTVLADRLLAVAVRVVLAPLLMVALPPSVRLGVFTVTVVVPRMVSSSVDLA